MRYRDAQLRGIPAFTGSGERIGRLRALIIDGDTHEVAQYAIERPRTFRSPFPKEFLVSRRQVLSVDEERIVVDDAAVPERAGEGARLPKAAAEAAGLSRMEREG